MKFPRPTLRFSLRAILLLVAALACFLGWRLWDSEKAAVDAIEREGGTVYFHYQKPLVTDFWLTGLRVAAHIDLDYIQLTASPREEPPLPTPWEMVRGTYIARHVAAVDIPLDKMTPQMVAHLKSLPDLRHVVVRVSSSVPNDSPEAKHLDELSREFSGKFHATYASRP